MNMMNKIYRILFTVIAVWVVTFCYAGNVVLKTTTNGTVTAKVNDVTIAGPSDDSSDKTSADQAGGTTVTLEIAPADGYYLYQLAITPYASGGSSSAPRRAPTVLSNITPTKIDDKKYTFIMPANMEKVEVSATFAQQGDLSTATITLQSNGHTYDFLEHTPKVNSVVLNSVTLTEGTDYTVSGNGPVKDVKAGGYTITVTGKGKYTGSNTATYMVNARDISDASITLAEKSFVYNKQVQMPETSGIGVYISGQKLSLTNDCQNLRFYTNDYTSSALPPSGSFDSNTSTESINKGTYTVAIDGKGNFSGTAKTKYVINAKPITSSDMSVTQSGSSYTYNGSLQYPTITVTDDEGETPYILQYGSTKDYTLNWSSGGAVPSPSAPNSTAVGNYSVTVSGTNNYTGSVTKQYTINASNSGYYIAYKIGDSWSTTGYTRTYTGSPITLTADTDFKIKKMAGTTPAPSTDQTLTSGYYDLAYTNNVNAGWATITAIGKEGYSFVATSSFKITPKAISSIAAANIVVSGTLTYNGSEQKPTITITDNTNVLVENRDYTLGDGETAAGDYSITINGIGNYNESTTKAYTIAKETLVGADIRLSATNYVYDVANAITPDIIMVKSDKGVVVPSDAYTLSCTGNTAISSSTNQPKVTITAKTSGNFTGSEEKGFTIVAKDISTTSISLDKTTFKYDGSGNHVPAVTVIDGNTTLNTTNHYTVTYQKDGNNIIESNSKEVGAYTVTITGKNNYTGSVILSYSIVSDNDEDDIHITLNDTYDLTYTGSPKKPGVTVTKGTGPSAITLDGTEDKDYELVYNNNVNAGQASVTVIGKGNYHFVKNQGFTIAKRDFSTDTGNTITIGLSPTSFVYNGSKQRPVVTVTDTNAPTGNQVLTENKDYTLSEGNINVGTGYTVTITGMGNYTGTKTSATTYAITTLNMTTANTIVTLEYNSTVFNGSEQKPQIERVTVNGIQLTETTDYTVSYPTTGSDYTNQGTKTITISGTVNFGGSKDVTYKITQKPLTSDMITLSSSNPTTDPFVNNSFTYNGSAHVPDVAVSDIPTGHTSSIITGNDYTVTNAGGTEIGIYYVTVAAKAAGNYSGTIKVPYSIVSDNSETGVTVTWTEAAADIIYTGNPITLHLTVKKGENTTLTAGTDYEFAYNNNINVGEATITILGKGNYHFVKYAKFNILRCPLTAAMVSLSANNFTFNGSAQKPTITVTYNGVRTEGLDYTLVNEGTTDVGTGYYEVTGIGNFSGTLKSSETGMSEKRYTISALNISSTSTQVSNVHIDLYPLPNAVYDGTYKEPGVQKVVITLTNNTQLTLTSGYTFSYSNNKDASTTAPTVTISGANFGTSTASTTFTILPKPLADDMVTLNTTSYTYDGTAKEPTATVVDTSLPAALQTLTSGTDYTITYSPDHTTPGEKVATITGQGNFKGSVKKTYTIVGASGVTITLPEATYTYNGAEHKPVVTVKKGDDPLTLNTDYTVAYSANINAGIATITVTGIGNYDFTQTKTFTIGKKPMTDAMVTLTGAPFTYNGGVQKPAVTVSDGSPSIISASDYTISNDGNINAGNYTVTVTATATGNYSGSGSQSYTINPYTLNATNTSVILDQSTFVYDRTAKQPNVLLVKVGDTMVVPTFTTAYSNNVNASNTATVTVTGSGNFTGSVDKTFVITPKSVTSDMIRFDKENFVYDGTVQKPTVTAKDGENTMTSGTDYTLTNEGGTNVGVYYAYIDGKGNYSGRASKPFYIITQNAAAFVVSDIADTEYDGTAKEPVITVTDNTTAPGTVLVKDENYTVSYLNNKDAGIATVIVTGMGSYAGTVTKNFNITPKPLAAEMISVSPGTFTFNGSLQRPDVTVTDGTIMKANDYTVINSGNVNQGTYYVTVIGQGNYKGTITNVAQTKYTITPLSIAEADVNLYELPSYVYDGTAKNPSVREVLVNNYVVPTTGYDVSYGTNIVAGPASITITGKGNFTGTKTVNFTIAQKEITSDMILLSNTEYIYTGELKKPEVTVKQGETTLTLDTDYTLSNNGGIYVGQYDVTVTGKGNYTGTASQTYNIIAQEAGSFVVTLSTESVVYTGGEQKPAVTVKKGDVTLNEGTDYTVMYIDNINVGMATVTVRGKGNYEGTVNKTFFITPKTLTGDMVTLSASSFIYNGVQQRPGVTVSDHDFLTSNDYYITNEGGVNIGSYNVIITGKSNYTGTVTKQFSITPLSLNDANIVLYEMASNIYDGKPKNPGVREVTVGTLVVPTTGYTTSVSPNINVGTVTVTVTGKDNFTGSAETTFVIMPKPLTSSMMTLTPTVFNYNGTVQKPSVTVKDGKVILTEDTDYTLTNEGGKEAGTYEVTVKGIGNYTDEATQSFIIVSSGANTFVVTLETSEYTFDGTAHKPAVTVAMDDRTLSEGTDYTLTYSKNTNAGTALVTVKGVGDYTGEQVKTFTILPKALTDAMVTLDKTSFIYNEKVQKPEVTVADGTIMTADDYTVTNDGGTDEGTYQVVVTGQNNYKGTVIKSFTITREEIHGDDDPEHPDEKTVTYTPTEEGSDEVKVSGCEGTETELEQVTSVTVPATFTSNGKTYTVVGISANAFANVPNLTDVYLPDTEEPLEIAEDAIPATATIHTTLALLDDYALMPSLSESFKAGKIKTTVTAKNRYWTFSSGVDVYVPDGVSVYIARERDNATVTIVELSDNDLTVGGQRIIKHNNGVLIGSEGNETPYDLVACGRRMTSGTTISTDDYKDYGSQNCLVPVIVATHFGTGYYFMKNNEFYSIQEEGEDVKVPAGKAVLYLHQAASSPSYSSVIQLVNTGEITNINGVERDADEGDWYDMSGRKLNGRPTKKGVYIQNNKKIVIR